MTSIIQIALGIKNIYSEVFEGRNDLDELKMHKLLYFAQKRHYKHFGDWLFAEEQEGWVHGPVNRTVRNSFNWLMSCEQEVSISLEEEYTIREIVHEYGIYSSWQLRQLSHEENAYKKSRNGLTEEEAGDRVIFKSHIIQDIQQEMREGESDLDCEVFQ